MLARVTSELKFHRSGSRMHSEQPVKTPAYSTESHLCSAQAAGTAPSPPSCRCPARPPPPLSAYADLALPRPPSPAVVQRAAEKCPDPDRQTDRQTAGRAQRGAEARSSPRRSAPLAPRQPGRAWHCPRRAQAVVRPGAEPRSPANAPRRADWRRPQGPASGTGPRPRPLPNSQGRRGEARSRRTPPRERPYLHGAAEKSARVGRQLLHVKVHDVHLRRGREGADSARTPAAAAAAPARPCADPPGGGAGARRSHRLAAAAASGAGPGSAAEVTAAVASRRREGGAGPLRAAVPAAGGARLRASCERRYRALRAPSGSRCRPLVPFLEPGAL